MSTRLWHFGWKEWIVHGEFESEMVRAAAVRDVKGGAIVDDPVGTGGEKVRVGGGGADGKHAAAGGFAGTRAGRSVFDNDAIVGGQAESGRTFQVRLGIRFASQDVAGGDQVMDILPEAGGAEPDFGERARGGSDDSELTRRQSREQFPGPGKSDNVGDIFNFSALHPVVFGKVGGRIGVGQEFANGCQTGAAVGELNGGIGIEIVFPGPTSPDAGDRSRRVHKDAVHIGKQAFTEDLPHKML